MRHTDEIADALRAHLLTLGEAVLARFLTVRREHGAEELAGVQHVALADTIYVIDHAVEGLILEWLEAHWPAEHPVDLVMEGVDEPRTFPAAALPGAPRRTLIIDPIDGTREIMWDRRSAWFLAALAPGAAGSSRLAGIETAVMVELPPTRHRHAQLLSARRGQGAQLARRDLPEGEGHAIALAPFAGEDLEHGFAGFGTPLVEGKGRVGRFAEAFFTAYAGKPARGLAIFDDQYLSTGGQMFDLLSGRLRLFGDLRPLFLDQTDGPPPLVCHPYDVVGKLVAEELGCVIEAPDGSPLDVPLDLTTPVAWVGFANERIAARARPILQRLLPSL